MSRVRVVRRTVAAGLASTYFVGAFAVGGCAPQALEPPQLVVQREWAGRGQLMAADLHMHTRFSDGRYRVAELVAKAAEYGCQAIAIADHADRGLKAATPEYRSEIEAARAAHPNLTILAGLEWNVPPRAGDEHATVLAPPGAQEWATLTELKDRFDDFELGDRPKPNAAEALAWLDGRTDAGIKPVVIYNHPSRKDPISLDNVSDLQEWRGVSDVVVGFEGAPGHQGGEPIGSYSYAEKTIDRWDPAAAKIGDAWDIVLQRGVDVHGAIAGSDFHNDNDRWPCQFAETWLDVPERTPAGVLRALRAGAFFGVHGHIVREVELTAQVPGLARAVLAGEVARIAAPDLVTASLSFTVPERDWEGKPNRVDQVEFIVVTADGASSVTKDVSETGRVSASHEFVAGLQGLVIRARGRRVVTDGPDLMFYTNAIRINVGGRR